MEHQDFIDQLLTESAARIAQQGDYLTASLVRTVARARLKGRLASVSACLLIEIANQIIDELESGEQWKGQG